MTTNLSTPVVVTSPRIEISDRDGHDMDFAECFSVTARRGVESVTDVHVRRAEARDAADWLRMRCDLWPEGSESEHRDEIARFFAGGLRSPLETLVATDAAGAILGFAELSIRPYAEDCVTDRVAYLEGWYVMPEARRRGVGRALVRAAEEWGRSQGCAEFASDALLDNDVSAAAHHALGFTETVQIRCFRKVIDPSKLATTSGARST